MKTNEPLNLEVQTLAHGDRFGVAMRGPFKMWPAERGGPYANAIDTGERIYEVFDARNRLVARGLKATMLAFKERNDLLYVEWLMVKPDNQGAYNCHRCNAITSTHYRAYDGQLVCSGCKELVR